MSEEGSDVGSLDMGVTFVGSGAMVGGIVGNGCWSRSLASVFSVIGCSSSPGPRVGRLVSALVGSSLEEVSGRTVNVSAVISNPSRSGKAGPVAKSSSRSEGLGSRPLLVSGGGSDSGLSTSPLWKICLALLLGSSCDSDDGLIRGMKSSQ